MTLRPTRKYSCSVAKAAMLMALLLGAITEARALRIGIRGVVSVGKYGVKTGKKAKGTRIDTPKCGGTICNSLDDVKKSITGEKEREDRKKMEDGQRRAYAKAQADLAKVEKEILAVQATMQQEEQEFADQKAAFTENAKQAMVQARAIEHQLLDIEAMLTESKEQIEDIVEKSDLLAVESAAIASQIEQSMRSNEEKEVHPEVREVSISLFEEMIGSLSSESQVTAKALSRSIKAFKSVESTHIAALEFQTAALHNISERLNQQSYRDNLTDLRNQMVMQAALLRQAKSTISSLEQSSADAVNGSNN